MSTLLKDNPFRDLSEDDLREKQSSTLAAMRAIVDKKRQEKRDYTPAENDELRRLDVDSAQLDAMLELATPRSKAVRPELPSRENRGERWVDTKTGREIRTLRPNEKLVDSLDFTPEQRSLRLGHFLRGVITGKWDGAEAERRSMIVGDFASGGALVPSPLAAQLWDLARAQSVVFRLGAQTVPMDSTTLDIARVTGDPSVQWHGGDEVRTGGLTPSEPTFGRAQLQAQTMTIYTPNVSVELAEDAPNFASVLEGLFAKTAALALDRYVLFGDGGARSGLRTWLTGNPTNSINETSMGDNGAAITGYGPFISAIAAVLAGNYPGELSALGLAMNPRTWAEVEALVSETELQPLMAPESYRQLRKLVSTQMPTTETQGSANDASTAFLGDFSQILVGIRTDFTFESSRVAGDSFSRLHVAFRGYLRADFQVIQNKWLSRIVGIIPPSA